VENFPNRGDEAQTPLETSALEARSEPRHFGCYDFSQRAQMKCAVCHKEWEGRDGYCPGCGAPVIERPRSIVIEVLLVAAALGLLLWLLTKGPLNTGL